MPAEQIEAFRTNGFVVVDDLLTGDELDTFAPQLTAAVANPIGRRRAHARGTLAVPAVVPAVCENSVVRSDLNQCPVPDSASNCHADHQTDPAPTNHPKPPDDHTRQAELIQQTPILCGVVHVDRRLHRAVVGFYCCDDPSVFRSFEVIQSVPVRGQIG